MRQLPLALPCLLFGLMTLPPATAAAQQADLSISKTDGTTTAVPGESITYTLVVRNLAGPDDVAGATVQDNFPSQLDCLWTCQGVGGASCTPGQSAGNINDTVVLPTGSTLTYNAVCSIDADATGTLSNTATVTAPPGINDPNPGNNSSSDLDTDLTPEADLTISKTDNVTSAIPGQDAIIYEIVARNPNGPSDVQGVSLQDVFPASLDCLWTCVASGGAACTPGQVAGDIDDTLNLPVGGRAAYTAQCNIDPMATGTLHNSASLALPLGATDPNLGNNVASDLDTQLTPRTDVAITKTDGVSEATPGDSLTYSITAFHQGGPSGVTGAVVQDSFPAPLSCSWTCIANGDATCNAGPVNGDIADSVNLPIGGSVTYNADCTIDPLATGLLSNTASVTVPTGVVDTNGSNNQATDNDTQLVPQVDLAITVDNGVDALVPGGMTSYTIVASNPALLFALGPDPEDLTGEQILYLIDPQHGRAQVVATTDLHHYGLGACQQLVLDLDRSLWAACPDIFGALHWVVVDSRDATVRRRGDSPRGIFSFDTPRQAQWLPDSVYVLEDEDDVTFLAVVDPETQSVQIIGNTGVPLTLLAQLATDGTEMGGTSEEMGGTPEEMGGTPDKNVTGASVESHFAPELDCIWTCAAAGGASCDAGPVAGDIDDSVDLPIGSSVVYTALCDIDPSALGAVSQTATLTPPDDVEEVDASDNSSTDLDPLAPVSDLSLTKSDGVTEAIPGQSVTYTLRARNLSGPSDAIGATVEDLFSSDLSCIWSCLPTGGASCTQGQVAGHISDTVDLPVGGEVTYTANCAIASGAVGMLNNTATVEAAGDDPNLGNNSASDLNTQLLPVADLTLSKSDGLTQAIPGESLVYSITASNPVGPSDIVSATALDTFADDLSCVWTCAASAGAQCTPGQLAGNIADNVSLPVGSSVTYTATCDIAADASGTLTNTASLVLPQGSSDPNLSNNSASDLDTQLMGRADLSISKDDARDEAVVGDTTTYTVEVQNAGPSDAEDVRVIDVLPSSLSCLWTCVASQGASCTAGPQEGDLDDLVTLPASSSVAYTGECDISAGASGELSNIATVQAPLDILDPDEGNNSAEDIDTLIFEADLAITKTDNVDHVVAGESVTYILVASNNGPSPADGAIVSDSFSTDLSCTWSCIPAGGAVCTAGPLAGDIDDSIDLPADSSVTYTAQCDISSSASGQLSNTATIEAPEHVTELDPSNDTASEQSEIRIVSDLSIHKSDGTTQATPGLELTYTLDVDNTEGPSDMLSATVQDLFPSTLTCSWTCQGSAGGSCGAAGGAGDLIDSIDLPVGASVSYSAQCQIDPSAEGFLSNTASVEAAPGTSDPDLANNTSTDNDTELIPMADLELTKSDGTSTVVAGTALVYSIQVRNPNGPSDVRDVVISDPMPEALACQWTCVAAAGATCSSGLHQGDINDVVDLPIGGNITYTAACAVDSSARGTLINTVTASIPDAGNFSASDSTAVLLEADLEISKTDGTDTAVPGRTTTYAIVARNRGPSDVLGATVIDIVPSGMTCNWTCEPTGGAVCDPQPSGNLVDIIDLPAGADASYTALCAIPPRAFGRLTNRARIEGPNDVTELDPVDNEAVDIDTLIPRHDLVLTKTATSDSVAPGGRLTYILAVTNLGPSDAQGVTVEDTLPIDATIFSTQVVGATVGPFIFADGFESGNTFNWGHGLRLGQCGLFDAAGGGTFRCSLGAVAPGTQPRVVIQVDVAEDATSSMVNTAWVESFTAELVLGNNTDSVVTILEDPDPAVPIGIPEDTVGDDPASAISVEKVGQLSADLKVRGDFIERGRIIYEVTLRHDGNDSVPNGPGPEWVQNLPFGLQAESVFADLGEISLANNTVIWNGELTAQGEVHLEIEATLADGTAGMTLSSQGWMHVGSTSLASDDPALPGNADATVFVVDGTVEIPTLNEVGLSLLVVLMAGLGAARLRREHTPAQSQVRD